MGFYVLDMENDDSPSLSFVLLGKPFLKTSKTKTNVYIETLNMEFDGEVINFDIHEANKVPFDAKSINFMNTIQTSTEKSLNLTSHDFMELVLS